MVLPIPGRGKNELLGLTPRRGRRPERKWAREGDAFMRVEVILGSVPKIRVPVFMREAVFSGGDSRELWTLNHAGTWATPAPRLQGCASILVQ